MDDNQNGLQPAAEPSAPQTRKSRRSLWLVLGAVALVAMLGGAAFIAGRLLMPSPASQNGNGGAGLHIGGPGGKSVNIHETKAKELPQTSPTISGIVVDRKDQILSVGTGNVKVSAMAKNEGQVPTVEASYTGPVVQVVITHDTKMYKDVTPLDPKNLSQSSGTVDVQQVLASGSLADIGKNTGVQVWGNQQGDRVVADVLVYRGF
jgi:hypothetical protein